MPHPSVKRGHGRPLAAIIFVLDQLSTWVGNAFARLIGLLMVVVCVEVLKRYVLNQPSDWIFGATAVDHTYAGLTPPAALLAVPLVAPLPWRS